MAFAAKYRGQCNDCGEWFSEGTMVHYNDEDQLVHQDCEDDLLDLGEAGTPCPECFLIHRGECL